MQFGSVPVITWGYPCLHHIIELWHVCPVWCRGLAILCCLEMPIGRLILHSTAVMRSSWLMQSVRLVVCLVIDIFTASRKGYLAKFHLSKILEETKCYISNSGRDSAVWRHASISLHSLYRFVWFTAEGALNQPTKQPIVASIAISGSGFHRWKEKTLVKLSVSYSPLMYLPLEIAWIAFVYFHGETKSTKYRGN